MATFLLKTEPDCYSFDDLVRDGSTVWDGITNPGALHQLRGAARGDEAFIYHTGGQKRIAGLARIARDPYADPAKPELNGRGEPKFVVVDLEPVGPATKPLTLADMKADERFTGFEVFRQPRLSVVRVPPAMDGLIRKLAGLTR